METKRSKYLLIGLTVICILLIGITPLRMGSWNRSGREWGISWSLYRQG